jgi:hypothetical protein
MVGVVVLAGVFLSLKKTDAHLGEELVAVREQRVNRLSARCARRIGQEVRRRTSIDHGERRSLQG